MPAFNLSEKIGANLDKVESVLKRTGLTYELIPVDENTLSKKIDDKYFENEIVILFYNYGSVPSTMYPNDRSNVDNWNIDFVYLNKNRTFDDTTFPLVTFSAHF